jgi:hypothetical protein
MPREEGGNSFWLPLENNGERGAGPVLLNERRATAGGNIGKRRGSRLRGITAQSVNFIATAQTVPGGKAASVAA